FLRVPRLFLSLMLWPLAFGLGMVVVQLTFTTLFAKTTMETADDVRESIASQREDSPLRELLYGSSAPLPPPKICRGPGSSCAFQSLDVSITVDEPDTFDASHFATLFTGNVERIHVCKDCRTDLNIDLRSGRRTFNVHSLGALALFALLDSQKETSIREYKARALAARERIEEMEGSILIHAPGLRKPIGISGNEGLAALVLNVAALVLITLWLALRAHRRVLDYFSRNGALQPLVASCGKRQFYSALWLVMFARVGCFLIASMPATVLFFIETVDQRTIDFIREHSGELAVWVIAVASSLGALMLTGSISDLKHRHTYVAFLYRYVPLAICIGTVPLWFYLTFQQSVLAHAVQLLLTALPLFGLVPILLAPVLSLQPLLLSMHIVFSLAMILLLLRRNTRWFAAHLEDL
ncbi:MAG: hypothetical protein KDD44_10470, partial [Bdellovibrionales bacterium]|nr:hypothetical protein [Bdellovibrionales bacterium]